MSEITDSIGDELEGREGNINDPKLPGSGLNQKEIPNEKAEQIVPQDKKPTTLNRKTTVKHTPDNLKGDKQRSNSHLPSDTNKDVHQSEGNDYEPQRVPKHFNPDNSHNQNSAIIGFKLTAQEIIEVLDFIAGKLKAKTYPSGGGQYAGELLVAKKISFKRVVNSKKISLEFFILIDRSDVVHRIINNNKEYFLNIGDAINNLEKILSGN